MGKPLPSNLELTVNKQLFIGKVVSHVIDWFFEQNDIHTHRDASVHEVRLTLTLTLG